MVFASFVLFCGYSFIMPAIVVMTTAPNIEEAESLAEKIVEAKLAACVQVLPEMKSFYFWEGAVKKEPEHCC